MDGYNKLKREIMAIRNSAHLNLFVLDCHELNTGMIEQCQELYDSLIKFQVRHSSLAFHITRSYKY